MFANEFIYDGISCREYNIMICSFDGADDGEMTAGSEIEFTYFKAPNTNRFLTTSATYNTQLVIPFEICKYVCSDPNDDVFTEREIVFIERWLNQKTLIPKYLQFVQEGYEDIYYRCTISLQKKIISGRCVGFICEATCDAPFGWSEEQTLIIESTTSTAIQYYDSSDEIGEIIPEITITSNADNQTILLRNTLSQKALRIQNCMKDETISLTSQMTLSSDECIPVENGTGFTGKHSTFFDDFNYQWFTIANTFNENENPIVVMGNCKVEMKWRYPRKAVV